METVNIPRYARYTRRTVGIVALFCAAGFSSAYEFTTYSASVAELYRNLPSQLPPSQGPCTRPFDGLSQLVSGKRAAATPRADRQWAILCLGFPLAMTLALVIVAMTGLLEKASLSRVLLGAAPLYLAPVLVLGLSAVSRGLLLIPALAADAYLLVLSLESHHSQMVRSIFSRLPVFGRRVRGASLSVAPHGSSRRRRRRRSPLRDRARGDLGRHLWIGLGDLARVTISPPPARGARPYRPACPCTPCLPARSPRSHGPPARRRAPSTLLCC